MMDGRLIVGLGNPGVRYANTRHNFGFMVLDALAERENLTFHRTRFGLVAAFGSGWLLKPQTFMNLSGNAVGPFCRYYRLEPSDLLVVSDDLDLPLGTLRLRRGGSSGGHNGLKSIIDVLGTDEFPRMRLGIDRPLESRPVIDWVLQRFPASDGDTVQSVIQRAGDALVEVREKGLEVAMTRYNGRG